MASCAPAAILFDKGTRVLRQDIIFSSDVDGIMNDYPDCFMRYLKEKYGMAFSSKSDAKVNLKGEYLKLKDNYRNSNYKFKLPYCEDALYFYKQLNQKDIPIIFSTSRQFEKYPHMYGKTLDWLQSSGIKFVKLVQKNSRNFIQLGVTHHVDDEIEHAKLLINPSSNLKLFILNRTKNSSLSTSQNFINVNSFDKIAESIFHDM